MPQDNDQRPAVEDCLGARRFHLGSSHTHRVSGELVPFEVDLVHGAVSTVYAARVLLLGKTWHALEGGTIEGLDHDARTLCVTKSVVTQINQLDVRALYIRSRVSTPVLGSSVSTAAPFRS
jgi:hypothetical protein